MYHRILPADDPRFLTEEPGMVVTPESFEMHLKEIRKFFKPVHLEDWLNAKASGETLPNNACAITFDDGWLDNYEFARPLLERYDVPATIFVVTDKIGTDFRFWPNIVSELIFHRSRSLANHPIFEEASLLSKQPFSRELAALCINRLKQHSEQAIFQALEDIGWHQSVSATPRLLMNWSEVDQLTNHPLIQIHSHTRNHLRLNDNLAVEILNQEIVGSKRFIKEKTNQAPSLFCFPNGDYCKSALELVHENYYAAVTTQRGINQADTLMQHELKRIPIHEDATNTPTKFRARLSCWF